LPSILVGLPLPGPVSQYVCRVRPLGYQGVRRKIACLILSPRAMPSGRVSVLHPAFQVLHDD
jgi:hypothetical protein